MPTPLLHDSRRLPGVSRLWDKPCAVLEVQADAGDVLPIVGAWMPLARAMLDAVGWQGEDVTARQLSGGVALALSAPVDSLYAAVDVAEWAWHAALAQISRADALDVQETLGSLALKVALSEQQGMISDATPESLPVAAARLRAQILAESNPRLLAIHDAARAHGVACVLGDELVTVGLGAGSRTWPEDDLPDVGAIDWSAIHDVPVVLVTGTDGKTTTTRLMAHIAREAGYTTGITTTDGVWVGGDQIREGDYAGPEGARAAVRDPRATFLVLETARGGLMRRGATLRRVDAAVVTNIAADHLGQFGLADVEDLAEVKLVVAKLIGEGGQLILNADDPLLRRRGAVLDVPTTWFSLGQDAEARSFVEAHVAGGGDAVVVEEGETVALHFGPRPREVRWEPIRGAKREALLQVADIPITLGGLARYNVSNALAAIGLAVSCGIPTPVIVAAMSSFQGSTKDNPGRFNWLNLGDVDVVVDYAHNPHGLAALMDVVVHHPARRKLVLLGQAGDRDDEAIRELARIVCRAGVDRVVVKELPRMLRGRAPGEVPALIVDELVRQGMPESAIDVASTELDAVRVALARAEPGDLLVLLIHADRREVMALLEGVAVGATAD